MAQHIWPCLRPAWGCTKRSNMQVELNMHPQQSSLRRQIMEQQQPLRAMLR
jgi:hypothetical protein